MTNCGEKSMTYVRKHRRYAKIFTQKTKVTKKPKY